MVELKLRWKVSLKVCIYRVSALGLLIQEQARTGYMHLNSRGYTRVEPSDELSCPEEPDMLAGTIETLDDATWLKILMKTGLDQDLIHELFSTNRPITNSKNIFQIV